MKKVSITTQIMIGALLGIGAGIVLGPQTAHIKFLGDIFLRLIQMSVVLIIMGAVIEAIGQLNPKDLGKLGFKIFGWFLVLTVIAAIIGIALGYLIKPGAGLPEMNLETNVSAVNQTIQQILTDFFPTNIIKAMSEGQMIQVIVFALLFGVALSIHVENTKDSSILDLIKSFNKIIIRVVTMIMNLAPIGVFALLAWVTGTIGFKVMIPLAKFLIAMGLGTLVTFVLFIVFVAMYIKVSPIKLAKKFTGMSIVALTTTSSAVSLPTQIEDSKYKLGISKRITNLTVPLGMALNSTGLSLYLALACITLAQFFNMDMTIGKVVQIVSLSTLACLGTVVVPGGGLVALAIVLPSMGLPLESIAILAGIDWFSGMFRTVLNVDVDVMTALLIAKDEGEINRDIFDEKLTREEIDALY